MRGSHYIFIAYLLALPASADDRASKEAADRAAANWVGYCQGSISKARILTWEAAARAEQHANFCVLLKLTPGRNLLDITQYLQSRDGRIPIGAKYLAKLRRGTKTHSRHVLPLNWAYCY
jgi:hypothetical protein